MSELEDLARRVAAVEDRLIMREAPPLDRLSGLDLRLDAMQALMQSIALSQNQHSRQLTELQSKLLEHDRRFDQLEVGLAAITTMLTTLIGRGDPGDDETEITGG